MDVVVVVIFGVILAATLISWRAGLLLTLFIGFLQDPVRKSIEGEPVLLTGLVAGSFAMVLLATGLRGELPRLQHIWGWRRGLRAATLAFVVVVGIQAVQTLVWTGRPVLALLGLGGYLAPLPAAWLAYRFAGSVDRVRTFLTWYAFLVIAVSAGVYLSFLGHGWPVLRQVGAGLRVFSAGELLEVHPGFWRSPEVAAWHAGAGVCVLVILWTLVRRAATRGLIAALIVYLVGAGLLTGRRKMLVEIVVFLAVYGALVVYFRHGTRRVAATVLLAVALVGTPLAIEILEGPTGRLDPYVRHGASGFLAAPGRFQMVGLRSIEWVIRQHGVWGVGAGTATQGAQHFGGGSALVGLNAEGGLGRVVTELGLPGLLVLAWLVVVLVRLSWHSMSRTFLLRRRSGPTTYGLVAFLAANAVTFVVASQVYGDLFVLLTVGWTVGMLVRGLSLPGVDLRTLSVLTDPLGTLTAGSRPLSNATYVRTASGPP